MVSRTVKNKKAKQNISVVSFSKYSFLELFAFTLVIGFLGFWVENISMLITFGVIDSRWYRLPFIYAYGLWLLLCYFALNVPTKLRFFGMRLYAFESGEHKLLSIFLYYLLVFLGVSIGEMFFGSIFELFTGTYLWDYTHIPFHLTRYTSIPTSLAFALAITLFMAVIFKPFMNFICNALNFKFVKVFTIVLGVLVVLDCLLTYVLILLGRAFMLWVIKIY